MFMTTSNSMNTSLNEGVPGEAQAQFDINDKPSSLPKAFLREMEDLLGDEYQAFLDSYRDEKTSAIRVNTLKLPIERFEELGLFDIDFERDKISWAKEGYYLSGDVNPGKNPLHDAGAYYIQEPSAMSVVGQTHVFEEDRVLDLCAAPGGKSTYILSRLNHKGLLVSNEINPSRIRALGENLERFGAVNSIITNSDSSNLLTFFKGFFDKIFVDAPCSGQGMFRKDDFAIEDWSQDKVDECVAIQRQLIRDAYQMLRAGGMIIYSTCTFTRQENEAIIEDFLEDYPDANLLDMDRIWPHRDRGEGHFCARITKKADKQGDQEAQDSDLLAFDKDLHRDSSRESAKKSKKKQKSKAKSSRKNQEYLGLYEDFATDYLIDGGLRKLLEPGLVVKEERLHYQPLDYDLRGLKVLRSGLFVGEFKKNRFEPAHSLAMALKPCDVKNTIDFANDSNEIRAYLRGESIGTGQSRGWVLVSGEGVSLGWGKESNGILKNKYPKGLRR